MKDRFKPSQDHSWATPQWLYDRFNEILDFKLDPCCSVRTAKCDAYFTICENGLIQDWSKIGNAYINPPYSKELNQWIKKAYDESTKGIICAMLLPVRSDRIIWHTYCLKYGQILFMKGRIKFDDQRDNATEKINSSFFASALVVFGDVSGKRLYKLNDLGIWMKKNNETNE